MTKKQDPKFEKPRTNADELISSYLGDLFGSNDLSDSSDVQLKAETSETDSVNLKEKLQAALASATVDKSRALITTVDLVALVESKAIQTKPQAFLMLLISLYYLRRPMTGRVRQRFVEVSERMLDDYEAAEWQAQISCSSGACSKGVVSEART